jgi:hypothetical protein
MSAKDTNPGTPYRGASVQDSSESSEDDEGDKTEVEE